MKRFVAAAAILGLLGFAGHASADSCPAGKIVAPGQGQARSDAKASGVTDVIVTSIDLSKEPAAIPGRLFRLRKLTVQPGGVVPWHSHHDRPALITIVSGEIVEYSSTCAVPILYKAGDSTAETHGTQHWWKNIGTEPAVLYSADLFPTASAHNPHTM